MVLLYHKKKKNYLSIGNKKLYKKEKMHHLYIISIFKSLLFTALFFKQWILIMLL